MSICEHLVKSCDSNQSIADQTHEEKLLNIQTELLWGLTYRNYKKNEKNKPILPMHSPINIPFELCRAEMLLKNRKKPAFDQMEEQNKGDDLGTDNRHTKETKGLKKRKISREKPTLLDRNVWSQVKYMDFLSIPNPKFYEEPKQKKYKKRCELEPCPPRFIQLAVPNKRKVYANWKEYAHSAPAEMLLRYEEILHTDQNLEPKEARYYYKKLDRQKRKELKKKRRLEKKKQLERKNDRDWQKVQIEQLAMDIVDYIQDEPLFTLNYKQMLLSDGILDRLERTAIMKKPSRKTKNHYKKTIIEVSDKFAIWIDTLTRFVDVQAIESDEDIPPLSIPSLSIEGEGEGESEYESSSEEELRDDQLFKPPEELWGEEGGEANEDIIRDLFKPGEGEGIDELEDMLDRLDGDVLEQLIKILSNCSDDFLDGEIDADKMPGVKYRDVLNRLKELRDRLLGAGGKKSFLEQIMIDWAIRNDPDNVNDDILKKIHEVAGLLGEMLAAKKPDDHDELEDWVVVPKDGEEGDGGKEDEGDGGAAAGGGATEGAPEGGQEGGAEEGGTEEGGAEGGGADGGAVEEEGVVEGDTGEGVPVDDGVPVEGVPADAGVPVEEGEVGEGPSDVEEGEKGTEGPEAAEVEPPSAGDEGEVEEVSQGTIDVEFTEPGEGGETLEEGSSIFEDEEGLGMPDEFEAEGKISGEELFEGEELAEPAEAEGPLPPAVERVPGEEIVAPSVDGRIIKGHKPSKVFEHSPDTVCCLSLKTWAVWLLEITHNAHNWTQWMSCVIQKVREYAAIVRGDVKEANGQVKVLRKAEWRKFTAETEESVVAWRQYSAHVKELSKSIVDNFHEKKVNCCPKCLQDHLITNVVVAHDTLQALTEAISCASYWQRCLDTLVDKTCTLTKPTEGDGTLELSSEESDGDAELEEICDQAEGSDESVYEIEELESPNVQENTVEI